MHYAVALYIQVLPPDLDHSVAFLRLYKMSTKRAQLNPEVAASGCLFDRDIRLIAHHVHDHENEIGYRSLRSDMDCGAVEFSFSFTKVLL